MKVISLSIAHAFPLLPDSLYLKEGQDLGRRRLQQKGDLYSQGGWWKLRWKEDQVDRDGKTKYAWSRPVLLGLSEGPERLTKPEARREAWKLHLAGLDQNMRTPQSIMKVREFVERKFLPEHVAMLKPGGRAHYAVHLKIVLDGIPDVKARSRKKPKPGAAQAAIKRLFGIGAMRLRDVTTEDCQKLVSAAVSRGYSVQYATHVRNAISGIFTHADSKDWFTGRNPAKRVKLPEMERKDLHALTFDQVGALIAALDSFSGTMVLCAVLTSMNIAEILGLRWRRVNLTEQWSTVDGESLPPLHIAVREQWYLRQYGSLKKGSRRRNVPVPPELLMSLSRLRVAAKFAGPDDPVFASQAGRPIDERNVLRRKILPAAKALGMPWIGWHDLRRTFSTLADQVGMSSGERQAVMGHARAAMTARYTKTPTEQARAAVERMAKLIGAEKVN